MNESVIKIKSGQYYNLTYENDQYYNLILKVSEYEFISSLEKSESNNLNKNFIDRDIEIRARFVGKSRIDSSPIFAIDLMSQVRHRKIEELIN